MLALWFMMSFFAGILFSIVWDALYKHYSIKKEDNKFLECQNCEYRRNYLNNSKFATYRWDRQRRIFLKKKGE